jgi:hypothetical protein
MRKLNMWQRLGVVASVLWVIGGGFWQRDSDLDKASNFSAAVYSMCSEAKSVRHDYDFKSCSAEADHSFNVMLEGSWWNVAAFSFGIVLLGWLMAWLSIRVGRWVLAGRDEAESK